MPRNPLAMQLYRDRKAALMRRVAAGTLTAQQAAERLKAFALSLMQRRGEPQVVKAPTCRIGLPVTVDDVLSVLADLDANDGWFSSAKTRPDTEPTEHG